MPPTAPGDMEEQLNRRRNLGRTVGLVLLSFVSIAVVSFAFIPYAFHVASIQALGWATAWSESNVYIVVSQPFPSFKL